MRQLLLLDEQNYDEGLKEIYRVAVRGIIIRDDKILVIKAAEFNEVKLPGGGIERGESEEEALIREVMEETGRHVIPGSVKPYGMVEEKRKSVHEERIWHQISRYYCCDVDERIEATAYTENEKRYGFLPCWISLKDAIKQNQKLLEQESILVWNRREYSVFKLIQDELIGDQ